MYKFHLGHFLKIRHVEKAMKLLQYQLQQDSPLYNNLDFSLYRQVDLQSINPKVFYDEYIAKDSFYYFKDKFYSSRYFAVQKAYKVREFQFLSTHSMILFYALGMYIRELIDKAIQIDEEIFSKKNINVFYGGKIDFEKPERSKIFYYSDYKDFVQLKEQLTSPKTGYKIYALSLDIKSFFYSINHKILLNIIDKKSSSIQKKILNYDECTKESISLLLLYLQQNRLGLPVSNQNLISSFLSSIYFSDFDDYVLEKYLNQGYHYIRYVDDFYLIFSVENNVGIKSIRERTYNIESDFAKFLIEKLELSVSTSKSERYEISDENSHVEFMSSSGLDSPFEGEFDGDDLLEDSILKIQIQGKQIPEIFDDSINILKNLKEQAELLPQLKISQKESAFLNYILILDGCLKYSKSEAAINKIQNSKIFESYDFLDFYLIKPKVLFHLVTLTKESRNKFFNWIIDQLKDNESMMSKLTIVDKFIHQMHFILTEAEDEQKFNLKAEFEEYRNKILSMLIEINGCNSSTYLILLIKMLDSTFEPEKQDLILDSKFLNSEVATALTQQIKLRRIGETLNHYNVSFNHLLNEFQSLFEIIYCNSQNKKANEITQIMATVGYSPEQVRLVSDFFERRNNNSISHSNSTNIGYWGVSYSEYSQFKNETKNILKKAIQHYNENQLNQ